MEFHISRIARDRYQFDLSLYGLSGNVIFANFHAARLFAQRMNQKRDLISFPERAVRAGQINAMGLIDEILHLIIRLYKEQVNPDTGSKAIAWLYHEFGKPVVDRTLLLFCDDFPPLAVYQRQMSPQEYLDGQTEGISNREIALEEMLMLWLTNANPATTSFIELFDDTHLRNETAYLPILSSLHDFFDHEPFFGPDNQNLIDMLRSPAIKFPYSLSAQLEYIRSRWGYLLGKYLYRILSSLDLVKEEESRRFGGSGPAQVYRYGGVDEIENFSPDREWMPKVVLIAKNTHVWLDQLSKKYQRSITRLDQIPDDELDTLQSWGFSGLWLIGLWERSRASQMVKQYCGNPDAVASAYSLNRYEIAEDLGGENGYRNLRDRAWKRGIRLASDMVPNHMGIDSPWVIEHPDWFISLDYTPFPSYSFNGPNLSSDGRVGLYLEDHYFSRTDAAVVFKRVDTQTGSEKYIFHGNDGTSMPWNDTAQLNYLNPTVREAVIQTIIRVARQFPIIRFDAAMTLAKKHYQRLWFPEPGTGGAIPSRSDYGLSRAQFDDAFPIEFWREVVDRVAVEAPDTLLLAEAFWLMEGYFVRTLGMHRVYNSAFMNMLRSEENANYRSVIKNTLEFDPEILKRFVNFMNNPDERTAVDQFGKDDKYFGVCTLMSTFPGLPMFGHGQIEGYTEKYGMEFRHPHWDEKPDEYLVQRHIREIFPLLHRRYLFADMENFLLYDFFTPEGFVNEDVIAYSNGIGGERALVVYHNRFADTDGWIRTSVGYLSKSGPTDGRKMIQKTLGDGLNLKPKGDYYCIFKDHVTGLEFIRNNMEIHEHGLYVELGAYKYNVFLDFRQVQDDEWHQYSQLAAYLNGRGVPSIENALKELFLAPIHHPFHDLVNSQSFSNLFNSQLNDSEMHADPVLVDETVEKYRVLLRSINSLIGTNKTQENCPGEEQLISTFRAQLTTFLELPVLTSRYRLPGSKKYTNALVFIKSKLSRQPAHWGTLIGWLFVHDLGKIACTEEYEDQSRTWIDEWLLGRIIEKTIHDLGQDEAKSWQCVNTIKLLTTHQRWYAGIGALTVYQILESWLLDTEIQQFIGINRYKGILWFSKEGFESLLWWMMFLAVIQSISEEKTSSDVVERIIACYDIVDTLRKAENASEFQLEKLLEALK
jgi:glycosidase